MCKDLDIAFLGRLFPPEDQDLRKKMRSDMQDAANVFQWNLIGGIRENGENNISVISYLPLDSWPKHYRSPFIKKSTQTICDGVSYHNVGFCNVTYLKQILNRNVCNSTVRQWANKKRKTSKKVLVCYSCNNVLMKAASVAKKTNPNVVVIQIIADITEFSTNGDESGLRKWYLNNQIKKNEEYKKYIDGYVLLTEQMRDKLRLNKPSVIVEGIASENAVNRSEKKDYCNKTILYTGSMNKKYGILELLEAFALIKQENYRLVLCGLGNAEPRICEAVLKDPRISYLGKVPREKVLQLQAQSTVVVNPRQNIGEYTKYSFPSKTMEYLASGVPLVAYKLDGIPDEYDEYITYVADNTATTFAKTLVDVCEMPYEQRQCIGERAKKFILERKNKKAQTKKILDLIQEI